MIDPELTALKAIWELLEPFDYVTQKRMLVFLGNIAASIERQNKDKPKEAKGD